jgi:hypothetical protein
MAPFLTATVINALKERTLGDCYSLWNIGSFAYA